MTRLGQFHNNYQETWKYDLKLVPFTHKRDEVRPGDGGEEVRDLPDHEGEGEQGKGGHLALLQHGGLHVTDSQPR